MLTGGFAPGVFGQGDLDRVAREIEGHAAERGWDRSAQLFALVSTAELVDAEPDLAAALNLDADAAALTPIDQELPAETQLESALEQIYWPEQVVGCAAVVERLVLPPDAEGAIPEDSAEAADFAAQHPDRQEMRIVAAVLRDGTTSCALRFRGHDDPGSVLIGPALVPRLLELLQSTFTDGPEGR